MSGITLSKSMMDWLKIIQKSMRLVIEYESYLNEGEI